MAFFDKLNSFAKNVGDKTKEAMEISRLNTKIRTEKAAIEAAYKKLGEHFYDKHTAGEVYDEAAEEIFAAIDASNSAIADLEAEIARIRAEREASRAAAPAPASAPTHSIPAGTPCPACGKLIPPGAKFCGGCGNSVASEPEHPVQDNLACPNCGKLNPSGTKFCGDCGTMLEGLQVDKQQEIKKTEEPEEPVKQEAPEASKEPDKPVVPEAPDIPETSEEPDKSEEPLEPAEKVCRHAALNYRTTLNSAVIVEQKLNNIELSACDYKFITQALYYLIRISLMSCAYLFTVDFQHNH
jgi:predicted nucleic acid-binding Zn ribbon protein